MWTPFACAAGLADCAASRAQFVERHDLAIDAQLSSERLGDIEQVAGDLCLAADVAFDRIETLVGHLRIELATSAAAAPIRGLR